MTSATKRGLPMANEAAKCSGLGSLSWLLSFWLHFPSRHKGYPRRPHAPIKSPVVCTSGFGYPFLCSINSHTQQKRTNKTQNTQVWRVPPVFLDKAPRRLPCERGKRDRLREGLNAPSAHLRSASSVCYMSHSFMGEILTSAPPKNKLPPTPPPKHEVPIAGF